MSKTLIFDFDGTLADTLAYSVNYAYEFNRKRKLLSKDKINLEDLRNMGLDKFTEKLKTRKLDLFFFLTFLKRRLNKEVNNIKSFRDLPAVIKDLKNKGVVIGVVTSNSKKIVMKFLENNDLNYFDFILSTSNYFRKDKLLNKAIKKCKLDKSSVIYIGDEVRDIEAARSSGIKIASVTWGYNVESVLCSYNPDYVIYQPKDLLNLLN